MHATGRTGRRRRLHVGTIAAGAACVQPSGPARCSDIAAAKALGGWVSNPRPADYENYGPVHRAHQLHGYHGVVPPMALIALFAPMTWSTNRSTHSMVITGCQLQNVTADSAA